MALTDKLKDVADAIRSNSTIEDKMSLDEMAEGISVVKSEAYDNGYSDGTKIAVEKPYINTSKMKNFTYLCSHNKMEYDDISKIDASNQEIFGSMFEQSTSLDCIPPINTSKGILFQRMFYNCGNLTTIPQLDTRNGTSFYDMFYGCRNLERADLDTSNGTKFSGMFRDCTNIQTLTISLGNAKDVNTMFVGCTALRELYFADFYKNSLKISLDLRWSPLSKNSITELINYLDDSVSGYTLTLKKFAVNRAFGINVDDEKTYPEGSEYYELRHSKDNWTISYL